MLVMKIRIQASINAGLRLLELLKSLLISFDGAEILMLLGSQLARIQEIYSRFTIWSRVECVLSPSYLIPQIKIS